MDFPACTAPKELWLNLPLLCVKLDVTIYAAFLPEYQPAVVELVLPALRQA